jgi:hypothetical protein
MEGVIWVVSCAFEMVQLLQDFQRIELNWLINLPSVGEIVTRSAFDLGNWLDSFSQQKSQAMNMGIDAREFEEAEEFVGSGQFALNIFSNGDFYPRNLIKLPEKVVVVDWEYWPGYRVCFIDSLENVAAFAFIHMWGNDSWRREFAHQLKTVLTVSIDDFRRAVCIKAFEQARGWQGGRPDLATAQVQQFRVALNDKMWAEFFDS